MVCVLLTAPKCISIQFNSIPPVPVYHFKSHASIHTEIFQFFFYGKNAGGDPNVRDRFKSNPHYQAAVDFCEKYDSPSFDDDYDTMPLEFFEPMVKRILSRTPYSCEGQMETPINAAKQLISAGYSAERR